MKKFFAPVLSTIIAVFVTSIAFAAGQAALSPVQALTQTPAVEQPAPTPAPEPMPAPAPAPEPTPAPEPGK